MQKQFVIVSRNSHLALAQSELVRNLILKYFPNKIVRIITSDTAGDRERSTPLHLIEGKDFFTKEIQDFLFSGLADFAVHSMKDVSRAEFFQNSHYAIVDRDDPRDVAFFSESVISKLKEGREIRMGTSSPRRSAMATGFLKKALPSFDCEPNVSAVSIRGNVDTRLTKLHKGEYDGIILAVAGLNRLLAYAPSSELVRNLLKGKRMMVLPLFECPPAAAQGAIVVETADSNEEALTVLRLIRNNEATESVLKERVYAQKYGYGCSQQFGVFHSYGEKNSFTYASGKDAEGIPFEEWDFDRPPQDFEENEIFVSGKMNLSRYSKEEVIISADVDTYFVSHVKAVGTSTILDRLSKKRVWVAGSKTWTTLAKKGIWVEGCADGLGLNQLKSTWGGPLVAIRKEGVQILTNKESALHWKEDGWNAIGTYDIDSRISQIDVQDIARANIFFWSSYRHYKICKPFIKPTSIHLCGSGKTADLLRGEGIHPIVFPTAKAFEQWRARLIF